MQTEEHLRLWSRSYVVKTHSKRCPESQLELQPFLSSDIPWCNIVGPLLWGPPELVVFEYNPRVCETFKRDYHSRNNHNLRWKHQTTFLVSTAWLTAYLQMVLYLNFNIFFKISVRSLQSARIFSSWNSYSRNKNNLFLFPLSSGSKI